MFGLFLCACTLSDEFFSWKFCLFAVELNYKDKPRIPAFRKLDFIQTKSRDSNSKGAAWCNKLTKSFHPFFLLYVLTSTEHFDFVFFVCVEIIHFNCSNSEHRK